jgi:putative colanic acid biosynthesis glycosyltransferase
VNTVANSGSTGRIAECIGQEAIYAGHQSWIAYGRTANPSRSSLIRIGSQIATLNHVCASRLFDRHGLASPSATAAFIAELTRIKPDIIHLHNIHGYYLNYEIFFEYITQFQIPVVWTLHDCWAFTGHCAYFESASCEKWKSYCHHCPLLADYPKSFGADNSTNNFLRKQRAFTAVNDMHVVTPSKWLASLVRSSFLSTFPTSVINYGIDVTTFTPKKVRKSKNLVLGVAKPWTARKGLRDFIELRKLLPQSVEIVLIGLTRWQILNLPEGITGLAATETVEELAEWYSKAAVFVNPTFADNFPVVNLEALACGTPVVTYDTGGSPESIADSIGGVAPRGDVKKLSDVIKVFLGPSASESGELARHHAELHFDSRVNNRKYLELYSALRQCTV